MTAMSKKPRISVGDVWWVRLPGASTCFEAKVVAVSQRIIQLARLDDMIGLSQAYERRDVRFVEKIASR